MYEIQAEQVNARDQPSLATQDSSGEPAKKGRKLKRESRSTELCQRLAIWKQLPEAFRPSLRALAKELRTSHQLLTHYLRDLEAKLQEERYRKAKREGEQLEARVKAEGRRLTTQEAIRVVIWPGVLKVINDIRRYNQRGQLPYRKEYIKLVKKAVSSGVAGSRELLNELTETQ